MLVHVSVSKVVSRGIVSSYVADETAALGHSYEAVVTDPDCVNGGYTTYTCSCGDSYVADETSALGHSYNGVETTAPSCEAAGVMTYTCSCGDSYTETIPAIGHAYAESGRVDATCYADGSITYTCGNCGDSYTEAIPSAGHVYDNEYDHDCNACGEIRVTDNEVVTSFGGNSVSEDVSGLAFKFDIKANLAIAFERISEINYAESTIGGYQLVKMGAVVANKGGATVLDNLGDYVIDIPAVYLCNLVEGSSASFAVRITDIPEAYFDREITARPYYIYEADGIEITIYGEEQAASYNSVMNG